jgi:hypothetical protein
MATGQLLGGGAPPVAINAAAFEMEAVRGGYKKIKNKK